MNVVTPHFHVDQIKLPEDIMTNTNPALEPLSICRLLKFHRGELNCLLRLGCVTMANTCRKCSGPRHHTDKATLEPSPHSPRDNATEHNHRLCTQTHSFNLEMYYRCCVCLFACAALASTCMCVGV